MDWLQHSNPNIGFMSKQVTNSKQSSYKWTDFTASSQIQNCDPTLLLAVQFHFDIQDLISGMHYKEVKLKKFIKI